MPPSLRALLDDGAPDREQRWAAFLAEFTPVLLRALRTLDSDEDAVMDAYHHVLDALRQDGFRRLRGYQPTEGATFASWLVVVARRLCLDHHRRTYGRPQGTSHTAVQQQRARRRLTDLVGDELALDAVAARAEDGPAHHVEAAELAGAIAEALAALPVEDRLILRLRFEDGVSVPEIARVLHEPSPFRMYRRLDRILLALRQRLTARGHAP